MLKAEDVYTGLLRNYAARAKSGARGVLEWSLPGRSESVSIEWELRANAVWRFGRAFLRCPKCQRLATRIYIPSEHVWPACRRCWGLTYESRQRGNYKVTGGLSLILGPLAYWDTDREREKRTAASEERYAERREILKPAHAAAR